jgi:hypothetical protein
MLERGMPSLPSKDATKGEMIHRLRGLLSKRAFGVGLHTMRQHAIRRSNVRLFQQLFTVSDSTSLARLVMARKKLERGFKLETCALVCRRLTNRPSSLDCLSGFGLLIEHTAR